MKKLLSVVLALTLLAVLAAPALADLAPASDGRAVVEAMERFLADNGKTKQTEDLNLEYEDIPWRYHYVDFDHDGIPELVRTYLRDAMQSSMDVFAARKTDAGYAIEKVASFVDDGYHLFGGGTDYLYRLGSFFNGTCGVSCTMPVYVGENAEEATEVKTCYYAYRDGAFYETEQNGFMEFAYSFDTAPFAYYAPGDLGACASAQNLTVDGEKIVCEKYNIFGSNYFKLRDIAMLLNGTPAQFSIDWDESHGVISVVSGAPYEPVGGELTITADRSATARVSGQTLLIDGFERGDLTAFNLDGNNFFKLRELGEVLGFCVDFDAATNTAVVTSKAP